MFDRNFILAKTDVEVAFEYNPVIIALDSMSMLDAADVYQGMSNWLAQTYAALSDTQRKTQKVVMKGVMGWIKQQRANAESYATFEDLIAAIANSQPDHIRDLSMAWMSSKSNFPGQEAVLADKFVFLRFIEQVFKEKGQEDYDLGEWADYHQLLTQPEKMQSLLVEHITSLWEQHVKAQLERTQPMLMESVAAFQQMDYSNLSNHEVVEAVTGRNFRDYEFMDEHIRAAQKLTFIPSPHLGPYVGLLPIDETGECIVHFGARLPKNAPVRSSELSRSELMMRLNALADDTRLQILELLNEHGELCAQDFINHLELSQSSASRHLRQLTAAGYLVERRREVAKCYSLNHDRFEDTIQALRSFISSR